MKQLCNVVMLTTEKADAGSLIQRNGVLNKQLRNNDYLTQDYLKEINSKSFHLYITSNDEIKDGDKIYHSKLGIGEAKIEFNTLCFYIPRIDGKGSFTSPLENFPESKKIIATTDKSLINSKLDNLLCDGYKAILPQIPESFIKAYVESNGSIKEVMVEYEEHIIGQCNCACHNPGNRMMHIMACCNPQIINQPKLRSDNTIIISQAKTYTRDEVVTLCKLALNAYTDNQPNGNQIDKWIKENL